MMEKMANIYGSTDTPIHRSRFYRFRKRFLKPSYIFILLLVVLWFFIPTLTRKAPVKNALRHISVRRNRVFIQFNQETVTDSIRYGFRQTSDSTCVLDIADAHLAYEWEQTYRYGDVSRISRLKTAKDTARILVTFSSLKDTPTIAYQKDASRFVIHFNRYLDSLFIIVLDPGHGGDNRGAVGLRGSVEKDIMLSIVLKLEAYLKQREDIRTYVTRRNDRNIGLFNRRNMAVTVDADLFLSIHANSARNRAANHSEVYYVTPHSRRPAGIVLGELERLLNNGRGFIRRRGYAVIRGNPARMGALLVELMYLSNAHGEAFLTDEQNQDLIARTLYRAVERILKEAG